MQQTIRGDCTKLAAFVCEHLFVCLHNPFSWEAVCCIHRLIEGMNKINFLLGYCFNFFSGNVVQVSPFFGLVLLQIELNTLKLQIIQSNTFVTKNQEPESIFAIFLFLKRRLIAP